MDLSFSLSTFRFENNTIANSSNVVTTKNSDTMRFTPNGVVVPLMGLSDYNQIKMSMPYFLKWH